MSDIRTWKSGTAAGIDIPMGRGVSERIIVHEPSISTPSHFDTQTVYQNKQLRGFDQEHNSF